MLSATKLPSEEIKQSGKRVHRWPREEGGPHLLQLCLGGGQEKRERGVTPHNVFGFILSHLMEKIVNCKSKTHNSELPWRKTLVTAVNDNMCRTD